MSMVDKIVQVIFRGKDDVTPEANKAGGAVEGFASKAGSLIKGLGAIAAGLALGEFFKKAVEEAQTSREAMGQLAIAVENSGVSFQQMAPRVDTALTKLARMTKFGDDDFAKAMQNMTLKTGDAEWALNSLGQVADLAAASNVDLEQASTVLAQAHEGNTKALFKMIPELKGAANWQELLAQKTQGAAEAQMLQLGPFEAIKKQFGEFAESVGKAILGNEEFSTSGFGVAEMLGDLATWVDNNSESIGEFIDVLVLTGKNIVEGLAPSFDILKAIAGPTLRLIVFLVAEMGFAFRAGSVVIEEFAGGFYKVIGNLVEKGGKVLKAFGIDVIEGVGTTIRQLGEKMDLEASYRWEILGADQRAFLARTKAGGDEAVAAVESQERKKSRIVKEELVDQERAYKDQLKAIKETYEMLSGLVVEHKKVLATLNPAIKAALDKDHAERFADTWTVIDANAKTLIDRMKANPLPPLVKPATDAVGELGAELEASAGHVMEVAENFGGLDEDAKAVLTTAGKLGETVKNLATNGLSFAGVAGVLGGVGSIVSAMMAGDKERRDLLRKNNDSLDKWRTEGVKLTSKTSGETLANVAATLTPDIVSGLSKLTTESGRKAGNDALAKYLAKSGLRMSDLDAIASELGMNLRRSDGSIELSTLPQLLQGLSSLQTAKIGTSFTDQLGNFRETQRITGQSGTGEIGSLLQFLTGKDGNISALSGIDLSDPTKARGSLVALFQKLNAGGISAGELGKASGEQFRSLLLDLIGMFDSLDTAMSPIGGDTGLPSMPSGTTDLPTSGVSTGISETVQDVVRAQTDVLSGILTTHTDFLRRTSDATEGAWTELRTHTKLLTVLLDRSGSDVVDQQLEEQRFALATQRGIGVAF